MLTKEYTCGLVYLKIQHIILALTKWLSKQSAEIKNDKLRHGVNPKTTIEKTSKINNNQKDSDQQLEKHASI